jgi:hypothetical protein
MKKNRKALIVTARDMTDEVKENNEVSRIEDRGSREKKRGLNHQFM